MSVVASYLSYRHERCCSANSWQKKVSSCIFQNVELFFSCVNVCVTYRKVASYPHSFIQCLMLYSMCCTYRSFLASPVLLSYLNQPVFLTFLFVDSINPYWNRPEHKGISSKENLFHSCVWFIPLKLCEQFPITFWENPFNLGDIYLQRCAKLLSNVTSVWLVLDRKHSLILHLSIHVPIPPPFSS